MNAEVQRLIDDIDTLVARPSVPPRPTRGKHLEPGSLYRIDEKLGFAVKVALTTGRPLLLTGAPGSGKSTLAPYLARQFAWRYYQHVLTGRTEATDLLYRFDSLRKLSDASDPKRKRDLDDRDYVEPGVLWWTFAPATARTRGGSTRPATEPNSEVNAGRSPKHAVVLLDEIDKADPDVPNALLEALGSFEFTVIESGRPVALNASSTARALIVLTSNGERALPPAFIRRCVTHRIAAPTSDHLVMIAQMHAEAEGRRWTKSFAERVKVLADVTEAAAAGAAVRRAPGTAEFLDAVLAAFELKIADQTLLDDLVGLTITKDDLRR